MSKTEQMVFDVEANVVRAKQELHSLRDDVDKLTVAVFGLLGLMGRMGLSENFSEAMRHIQRMISIVHMMRIQIKMLEAEMGPLGWTLLAIGMAGTVLTVEQEVESWMA